MQVAIQPTMNSMTRAAAHKSFEVFDGGSSTGFVDVAQFREVLRYWRLPLNDLASIMLARKFAGADSGGASLDAPPSLASSSTGAPPQQLGKVNYVSFLTWAYGGRSVHRVVDVNTGVWQSHSVCVCQSR